MREQVIKEFAEVINRYNVEQLYGANVPDFILAEVAMEAVETFTAKFKAGCDWYSVHLEPCGKSHFHNK